MSILNELGIPLAGFILFFIIQSRRKNTELFLTGIVLIITLVMFLVSYHENELLLFLIGVAMGVLIEVVFRYFGSQQSWKHASFFGVPYWLPLAWGIGFIIITRLGIFIRSY